MHMTEKIEKKLNWAPQLQRESPVIIINGSYAGFCPFTKIPHLYKPGSDVVKQSKRLRLGSGIFCPTQIATAAFSLVRMKRMFGM